VIFTQDPVPVQPMPMPVPVFPGGKGGVIGNDVVAVAGGGVGIVADQGGAPNQVQPFDVQRDALWPKSVLTWLILSVVFLFLSVQAVSPTRRWHIRRRKRPVAKVPE
jgi:hypothetical protein